MVKKKTGNIAPSAIAVIYARYSSHSQKDVSIEQQVDECMEYARENNLQVINVYSDRHLTGRTDKRPEFQKMMRHAEKNHFQVIVAWKSNRMARNMLQSLLYEDRLAKIGIRVVYAKEEFGDNAAGRFALRSMMNVNQFYSENMAEDIKRGLRDNAENCMITNGCLPFGYRKSDEGKYLIDKNNAPIVREIFGRVACGETFTDIGADLNARGIRTSRKKEWGKNSFQALLANERYTGVYIYDDIRIEGGIPQIIDKELFLKVQDILHTKKNPQGRHRINGDYLLTGKLYCGICKGHMVGMSGTGRSGQLFHYYVCQKKRVDKACNKEAVRRDDFESTVAAAIKDYVMQDKVIEWIADSVVEYGKKLKNQTQLSALESQLSEAKKATRNILSAIEQGIITESTKDRLLELEANQAKLAARIAREKSNTLEVSRDYVIAWLQSFRDGDILDKTYQAKLFDTFLIAAYLYDGKIKIVFNFTGKKKAVTVPLSADKIDSIEETPTADGSLNACFAPPDKHPQIGITARFADVFYYPKYILEFLSTAA